MDRVREELALPRTPGLDGTGVRVAVIDTGVDVDHPDLADRIHPDSRCLFGGSPDDLRDVNGHGTHVAGIIAGSGSASDGLYRGVAPGVELIVLRVSRNESAESDTVVAAIDRAIEVGADVINYSAGAHGGLRQRLPPPWVWPTRLRAVDAAFKEASRRGILCVAAAGNEGPESGSVVPPALRRFMLAVGASGRRGAVASGSARGPVYLDPKLLVGGQDIYRFDSTFPGSARRAEYMKPDLVAPGGEFSLWGPSPGFDALGRLRLFTDGIVSCRAKDTTYPGLSGDRLHAPYTKIPGTSMATAVVSGVAALALQLGDSMDLDWGESRGQSLKRLLCHSARPLATGGAEDYGHGAVMWPVTSATIEDCVRDPRLREIVLLGAQLWLSSGDGS